MKEKLEKLLTILMEKKYSPEVITQAILLPGAMDNKEEFMDRIIEIAKTSKTEQDFYKEMENLTAKN